MSPPSGYFFCGVGGSGMLPLALILRGKGAHVEGSDRSLDQGRLGAKFEFLTAQGVALHPQDGSGLRSADQILVVSAAVEDTVPDVVAAKRLGARIMTRAELLAELFNAARFAIAVGGTSGKSTTTGMIGWVLHAAGKKPTIMNGAVMKNFVTPDALFASALVGAGDLFVSEVDESDGSIARYRPRVAVLNNLALDHKSMDELRALFGAFIARAQIAVVNLDNAEAAALAAGLPGDKLATYAIDRPRAHFVGRDLEPAAAGIAFTVTERATGAEARVTLQTPGRHNVENALAALAVARACGLTLETAAEALGRFTGIRRRLEFVGSAGGVTVIDDFAHNPDKIAATLATLHAFPGRLLIMFQPHGFGPLRLMRNEFIACFADHLAPDDVLLLPQPAYYGGTVDRSVSSSDIVGGVVQRGRRAEVFEDRTECGARLLELARPGDRIVVMGARDDTLTEFAEGLVRACGAVTAR